VFEVVAMNIRKNQLWDLQETFLTLCMDDCLERMNRRGFDGQYYNMCWVDFRKRKVLRFYVTMACLLRLNNVLPCEVRMHLFKYFLGVSDAIQHPGVVFAYNAYDTHNNNDNYNNNDNNEIDASDDYQIVPISSYAPSAA